MTSLERMMAAIRGEPFDRYPYVNPYMFWSMMPHWPELNGLTFLHASHGTDEQHLSCLRALRDKIGLDWLQVEGGLHGAEDRFAVEVEKGVPVLVDLEQRTRTRFEEFPKDMPVTKPRYKSARDVEALPPPSTVDELLASHHFTLTRKIVETFGSDVFLFGATAAPFAACYYSLGFDSLFDAISNNRSLLHAIGERTVEESSRYVRTAAQAGLHAVRINDFFCSAELISEKDYLELVWPYEKQILDAMHDAGVVSILETLGWVEPRLPHIARLEVDCLQTESSLKNYRNDVGEIRRALGEEVCIFGNSRIRQVIEEGDEETWRKDAVEQARGVGRQRRYAICAGSPTTWNSGSERLRRFGAFMRKALSEVVPLVP